MLCHLKILNSFIFELVFLYVKYSETKERECAQKRRAQYACPSFFGVHSNIASAMPHEHRILMDLPCVGVQQDSKPVEGEHVCCVYNWANGGTDTLEGQHSPFHLNLLQTQNEGNGFLRNMLPYCSQPLTLKMMTEWIAQPTVLIPFSPFLFISKLKVNLLGRICMYQEVK